MRIAAFLIAMLFAGMAWAQSSLDVMRPATGHVVPYTTTSSTDATAIGANVEVVRIVVTSDAFIAIESTNPLATNATGTFLPAFTPEYFRAGGLDHLAVRASGTSGTLYMHEMVR